MTEDLQITEHDDEVLTGHLTADQPTEGMGYQEPKISDDEVAREVRADLLELMQKGAI